MRSWAHRLVQAWRMLAGAGARREEPGTTAAAPGGGASPPPSQASQPSQAAPPEPPGVAERSVRVYLQKHRLGIQMTGLEGVDASGIQTPPQELWFMNSAN